jgi:sulfide:quinone oxidoreductase
MEVKQLAPMFAVTGQLGPADLAEAARLGFRGVVCARPDGEEPGQPDSAPMAAEAARLGLGFAYIPIVPGHMDDADADRFGRVLSECDGPLLGYCRTGARAEGLWRRARELAARPR